MEFGYVNHHRKRPRAPISWNFLTLKFENYMKIYVVVVVIILLQTIFPQ